MHAPLRRYLLIALLSACALPATVFARAEVYGGAPRMAVTPFLFPEDPDYGVYLSDVLTAELMNRSYVPALKRLRFVLVEPDTLPVALMQQIRESGRRVPQRELEAIRERTRSDFVVVGHIDASGIRTVNVRVIDLNDGRTVWSEAIKDDPAWTWSRANQNVGEIAVAEIVNRMGFAGDEAPVPPLDEEALPSEVLLQPLHTVQQGYLAADCRVALREGLSRDGLFSLLPGEIKPAKGEGVLTRIGASDLALAQETTLAEAILCGSLASTGKDGTIHNLGLALRLVAIPSGRILWAGATTGRKIWRWDKLTDIVGAMTSRHLEVIAQFGASAAEGDIALLAEAATDGPSWCAVGEAYLRRGLLEQAENAFNRGLSLKGAEARAKNGLGLVFLRRPEFFNRAVTLFREAMNTDPDYLEPYVNLARAYLTRDMTEGVNLAQRAIEKDPDHAPAYEALGRYFARTEQHENVIRYLKPYLRLQPDDISIAVLLGRSLLRVKAYNEIDQVISPIVRRNPDANQLKPIVAMKALATAQFQTAESLFDEYLNRVMDRERALYQNIQTVIPESAVAGYEALPPAEREVYAERFWRSKDPDLSTEVNERRLEHMARVWTARQDFGQNVYPWDRRGDVYIRYGEPDYRSRSGFVPSLTSPRVQEVKERVYAELYGAPPQGELVGPVFPIRSSRGITLGEREDVVQNAMGLADRGRGGEIAGARLDPQSQLEGENYAPVTLFGDYSIIPWESWVYVEVGGGMVFDFTKEAGGSAGYDFAPIPPLPPSIMRSTARMAEYAPGIAFDRVVSESPDAFTEASYAPLEGLAHDALLFRGDSLRTRVDVVYSVPLASLRLTPSGQERVAVIQRSIALADSAYDRVFRRSRRIRIPVKEGGGDLVDIIRADVTPGLYHLSVRIHDVVSGRLSTRNQDIRVEPFGTEQLHLSDLMLATAVGDYTGDVRFRRGEWEVIPRPTRTFGPPLMRFYYEIYNLTRDSFGRTRYSVTTTVKHESGIRARPYVTESRPEVSLTVDQAGDRAWERSYLEVDLSQAREGRNLLQVTVRDDVSGQTTVREAYFTYRKP